MSNKGIQQTALTRSKISLAKQKDRIEIINKLKEYILGLTARDIPSVVSAALFSGISKKALLAWELTTPENSDVRQLLDSIRDLQEKYLRENGLKNKLNGHLTALLLKADHNVQENPPNLVQNNTFNISPELLAEAIELSRSKK